MPTTPHPLSPALCSTTTTSITCTPRSHDPVCHVGRHTPSSSGIRVQSGLFGCRAGAAGERWHGQAVLLAVCCLALQYWDSFTSVNGAGQPCVRQQATGVCVLCRACALLPAVCDDRTTPYSPSGQSLLHTCFLALPALTRFDQRDMLPPATYLVNPSSSYCYQVSPLRSPPMSPSFNFVLLLSPGSDDSAVVLAAGLWCANWHSKPFTAPGSQRLQLR